MYFRKYILNVYALSSVHVSKYQSLSFSLRVCVCVCTCLHVVMVPVKAQESYSAGVWTMRARESVREHRNAGAGCVSAPELKVDLFCTVHFAAVSNFLSRNSLCDVTVAL